MPPMDDQPTQEKRTILAAAGKHLRAKLVAGVLALIPLVVTVVILRFVFDFLDGMVQPLVERIFGREIVGVGIGITIVAVYLMGLVATNFLGRATIQWLEAIILRVPVVRWVYNVAKGIVDALSAAGRSVSRVVIVQWPKPGTYTIGFVTNSLEDEEGKRYCNVLIPTTPTPQTGFLAILPEEEITFTDLSVEEGIRMVVSSGVLAPTDLMRQIKKAARSGVPAASGEETLAEAGSER